MSGPVAATDAAPDVAQPGRPEGPVVELLPVLHGIQLWAAQPDATRHQGPAFAHHADLPVAEYGPCRATVLVGDDRVRQGVLAYLGRGRDELALGLSAGSRALLLGGRPFGEDLLMWWNFVARTRDEIEEAWREWEQGAGFGRVASGLARIPAPRPTWLPGD